MRRKANDRQQEALVALMMWRALTDARDDLIRDALAAGCSRYAIAEAAGLSRQHLYDLVPVEQPGSFQVRPRA